MCEDCDKECYNVKNLMEHKKFKHPHTIDSTSRIDTATQMSPQNPDVYDDDDDETKKHYLYHY